jgi:hypothetical protein
VSELSCVKFEALSAVVLLDRKRSYVTLISDDETELSIGILSS